MSGNIHCEKLLNCISFHQENVRFCTTLNTGKLISTYKEKDAEELAERIIKDRKLVHTEIPQECKDCIHAKQQSCLNDKITRIDLFYWYHCNCSCFYCSYRDKTLGKYSDKVMEGNPLIYKTIKQLYKEDKIDRNGNLEVIFGGGEIGVLKEAPKLIQLFLNNECQNIQCESSGIKYVSDIGKMLKLGRGGITIAICCGNREIYRKIKKRDKYNQVLKNLKKYVNEAKKNKINPRNSDKVISKFIILSGFNNTKEDVENWLQESNKIGLTKVEISMEFCWGIHTKKGQPIEEYNYELFEYATKRCKELNLILIQNETSLDLMKKGKY